MSDVVRVLSTTPSASAEDPQDEITRLVESSVDQRIESAISELSLEDLIDEARERYRRQAANYVI